MKVLINRFIRLKVSLFLFIHSHKLAFYLQLLVAIFIFSYNGISFLLEEVVYAKPFSIESMLNPVSTEGSDSQNTGGSGGGSGGGSSSIVDTTPTYDTTKLANYLETKLGYRLGSTGLIVNKAPADLNHNMSRILAHVKLENPGFFNLHPSKTLVNKALIECIRDLHKNYP